MNIDILHTHTFIFSTFENPCCVFHMRRQCTVRLLLLVYLIFHNNKVDLCQKLQYFCR